MEEFEEEDDVDLNQFLDTRFVIMGLVMMIVSLPTVVFVNAIWAKYIGFFCFIASFFVMTKKAKEKNL